MKINGVEIFDLKIIKNSKGDILKFLSKKDKFFRGFGEVYFSEIKKKKIKGWNFHKKNTCVITVPFGKVIFHLIDGRKKSKTFNQELKISIGRKRFKVLIIPPGIWFSFKSLNNTSIITNFSNKVHSKIESKKSNIIKNIKIPN